MGRSDRRVERVREVTTRVVPVEGDGRRPERVSALELLLRRSNEVLRVARLGSALPDGFPSRSSLSGSPGAGKGARMQMRVPGEDGPEWVATSSTEQAALELAQVAGRRVVVDPYRPLADRLDRALDELWRAVVAIEGVCAQFDRLRDTAAVEDAPQCWVAQVVHRLPWSDDWTPSRRTTFEGVLDRPWPEERPVCEWVYRFVRRHRVLPTREELLTYQRGRYVRVREGVTR